MQFSQDREFVRYIANFFFFFGIIPGVSATQGYSSHLIFRSKHNFLVELFTLMRNDFRIFLIIYFFF